MNDISVTCFKTCKTTKVPIVLPKDVENTQAKVKYVK